MPLTFKNRCKMTVAVGGAGTLTLGAAPTQYVALGAGENFASLPYVITDGTAWETGYGTWTNSGTTFARTRFEASSTGSALTVSTNAFLFIDVIAGLVGGYELAMQTYITGMLVTKHPAANTIDISAGQFYDPSTNHVISWSGFAGLSPGTLGASQWNQVYAFDNGSGTVNLEFALNADPPSGAYAGTARMGGTGGNRRWIGSFLTDASSNIYNAAVVEAGRGVITNFWLTSVSSAPFRVLSGVSHPSTYASQSLVGCIPRYVGIEALVQISLGNSVSENSWFDISIDGSNRVLKHGGYTLSGTQPVSTLWTPISSSTPNIWYQTETTSGTAAMSLDVGGFKALR